MRLGGNDEVAAERNVAAETGRSTIDRGHGRFGQSMQIGDRVVRAPLALPAVDRDLAGRGLQAFLHCRDIAARAEGFAAPRQHHGAHGIFARDPIQDFAEFDAHGIVYGIADIGTVECDDGDTIAFFDLDSLR